MHVGGAEICIFSPATLLCIGKGVPNVIALQNRGTSAIQMSSLLTMEEAALSYRQHQGILTEFNTFGSDPLSERNDLVRRRLQLFNPSYDELFTNVVSSDGQQFIDAIMRFISITQQLYSLI